MIKLNAGFSRKVGEANYGSRGASVNVELELESGLIGDPDGLMTRIRKLFDIARQSVDNELTSSGRPAEPDPRRHTGDRSQTDRPDDRRGSNGHRDARGATTSQIRAIESICRSQGADAVRLASERYGVRTLEDLSIRQASDLIDTLKSTPVESRGNGGR